MVTFICENCDTTLKKKQCQKHQCKPIAMICIDCHEIFRGISYKKHISCFTEQQKHWGQYAKTKHITKNNIKSNCKKNNNHDNDNDNDNINNNNNNNSKYADQKQDQKQSKNLRQKNWRGWKNEIKTKLKLIKQPIELTKLYSKCCKRFKLLTNEDPINSQQFYMKLQNVRKIKIQTYISLQ